MPTTSVLLLFLGPALLLAAMPGPGMLFIIGRTVSAGQAEGYATCAGTALGGFVHVLAGAFGLSALLMASAEAFTLLKLVGAIYLVWLAVQTWRSAGDPISFAGSGPSKLTRALQQGAVVEATNPKTAVFFLALIPHFVDPGRGSVALQFISLGIISVAVNTIVAMIVATLASSLRKKVVDRPDMLRRLRQGSAGLLGGLGVALLLTRKPA